LVFALAPHITRRLLNNFASLREQYASERDEEMRRLQLALKDSLSDADAQRTTIKVRRCLYDTQCMLALLPH
jgi:hypothetical protein